MTRYFLEIWDSAGTSKLETLRSGPLTTEDVISVNVTDEVNGIQELSLKAARELVTVSSFALGNTVRLVNDYKTNDPYRVYRIKSNKDSQENNKKAYLECICEHLKYDLQDVVITETRQFIQTSANDILDYILSEYADDWTRGTITNGTNVWDFDLEFGESVYDCIKRFAETMGLETLFHADGSDLGNDADWMEIDILIVTNTENGTPGTLVLNTETNIKSLNYDKDVRENFATRIYAAGGGCNQDARYEVTGLTEKTLMGVENAQFEVKSVSGDWITLYSKNCVIEADSLNGYYIYCQGPTGANATPSNNEILDSDKTSDGDRINVAMSGFSPNPVEGDILYFCKSSTLGDLLDCIPNAKKEADYWPIATTYSDSSFEDYINLAGPTGRSDLSGTYSYGYCDGWNGIGSPAATEDATDAYIINGIKTQKIEAAAGDGVYAYIQNNFATGEKVILSFWVWLTITSLDADAYVDLKIRYGANDIVPIDGLWVKGENDKERIISETFSTPSRVLVGGLEFEKKSGYDPRLEITCEGGSGTFYIDSVCVVRHPVPLGRDRFIAWDSRAKLWEDAVIDYNSRIALPNDFGAQIMDIYHNAPTTNSAYEFSAGDSCTLTADRLDLDESARITKKSFDAFNPILDCKVDFSIGAAKTAKALQSEKTRNQRAGTKSDYNYLRTQSDLQAGFESVVFEDSNKNVTKQGRSVNRGLTNGAWMQGKRMTWNEGKTS